MLFLKRYKEVGVNGQWGLFSSTIPGRVGYQCLAYFRKLVQSGEIEAPVGFILNGKTKSENGTTIDIIRNQTTMSPLSKVSSPRSRRTFNNNNNKNKYGQDIIMSDEDEISDNDMIIHDDDDDEEEDIDDNNANNDLFNNDDIIQEQVVEKQIAKRKKREKKDKEIVTSYSVIIQMTNNNNNNDNNNNKMNKIEICIMCGGTGDKETMVYCHECGEGYHHYCLNPPPTLLLENKLNSYEWRCVNCKVCEICNNADNEECLLVCDYCDKAYHTHCIGLSEIPIGNNWICHFHNLNCKGCNLQFTLTKLPFHYCDICSIDFQQNRFCILCDVTYVFLYIYIIIFIYFLFSFKEGEEFKFLKCVNCESWTHIHCDSNYNNNNNNDNNNNNINNNYKCKMCTEDLTKEIEINKKKEDKMIDFEVKEEQVKEEQVKEEVKEVKEEEEGEEEEDRKCIMCEEGGYKSRRGNILPAEIDTWVHTNCALWSNECYESIEGGIVNVSKAISRSKLTVYIFLYILIYNNILYFIEM